MKPTQMKAVQRLKCPESVNRYVLDPGSIIEEGDGTLKTDSRIFVEPDELLAHVLQSGGACKRDEDHEVVESREAS